MLQELGLITRFDHIVLTVLDIQPSVDFYQRVLQMEARAFGENRWALHFGQQKINLQTLGMEKRNRAAVGSGDLCLITDWSMAQVIAHLHEQAVPILEGPVRRTGAKGPMLSVYFVDPDQNLIEVSSYSALDEAPP